LESIPYFLSLSDDAEALAISRLTIDQPAAICTENIGLGAKAVIRHGGDLTDTRPPQPALANNLSAPRDCTGIPP